MLDLIIQIIYRDETDTIKAAQLRIAPLIEMQKSELNAPWWHPTNQKVVTENFRS